MSAETTYLASRRLHLRVVAGVTLVVVLVLLGAAGLVLAAERNEPGALIKTYPDALWWAMETISTVGYGDLHPVTLGGRLVAVCLMVMGIALIGLITATVVAWFFHELDLRRDVRQIERTEEGLAETLATLREEVHRLSEQLEERDRLGR